MTTIPLSMLIAFTVAVILTPLVHRLALRIGAMDAAGALHRKVHTEDIPRLGGLAIITAFYAPLLGLLLVESDIGSRFVANPFMAYGMLGGGLAIAALGIVDDVRGVTARTKFLVQFAVAIGVVSLGFRIRIIEIPSLPAIDGLITFPLSVLWIVGLTNAMNLIDGLDGLAAGLGLFGLVPMIVTAVMTGNLMLALVCCTLAGSLLGFLLFNFHPAKIFMGDSGSMFLGFILALITVTGASKGPLVVSFLAPILALGIPIMDTLLAMGRRALLGQPLFAGDDGHIHHRLRKSGLSHRRTVLTMYGIALLLAGGSLLLLLYRQQAVAITVGAAVLVCAVLMRSIGYLPILRVRSKLRATAKIRGRNRMLYARLRQLMTQLNSTGDSHGLRTYCENLSGLLGARGGTLSRCPAPDGPELEALHSWGCEVPESGAEVLSLPIRTLDGERLGELRLLLAEPGIDHAGLIRVAEHGCVEIARSLDQRRLVAAFAGPSAAASSQRLSTVRP